MATIVPMKPKSKTKIGEPWSRPPMTRIGKAWSKPPKKAPGRRRTLPTRTFK